MQFSLILSYTFIVFINTIFCQLSSTTSASTWDSLNEPFVIRWNSSKLHSNYTSIDVQLLNYNDNGLVINYLNQTIDSTNNGQMLIPKQYIPPNNNFYFDITFKSGNEIERWKTQPFSIVGNSVDALGACAGTGFSTPTDLTMWYCSAHPLNLSWNIDITNPATIYVDYVLKNEDNSTYRYSILDKTVQAATNDDTFPEIHAEKGDRYFIEAVIHQSRTNTLASPICQFKTSYFKIRNQWGFY